MVMGGQRVSHQTLLWFKIACSMAAGMHCIMKSIGHLDQLYSIVMYWWSVVFMITATVLISK